MKLVDALQEAFRQGLGQFDCSLNEAALKMDKVLTRKEMADLVNAIQFMCSEDGYKSLEKPGGGVDYPKYEYKVVEAVTYKVIRE